MSPKRAMPPRTTLRQFFNLLRKLVLWEKEKWEAKRRSKGYQRDWDHAFQKYLKFRVMQEYAFNDEDLTEEEIEHKLLTDKNKNLHYDFLISSEGEKLATKHNMNFAYHYDSPVFPEDESGKKTFLISVFRDAAPVTVLPADKIELPMASYKRYTTLTPPSKLREGRFLTVEIDLQHPMSNIMISLNYHLYHYSNYVKQSKRKRSTKVDPIIAWDMAMKGMNPYEITKELFPDSVGASDFLVYYKRVDRAIKKAAKEIGEVSVYEPKFTVISNEPPTE